MKFLHIIGLYLFTFAISVFNVQGLEDATQRNSSKPSDFKLKLSKLSAKSFELESGKLDVEDYYNESISALGITVPPDHANDTIELGHHTYYNSTFYSDPVEAKKFWVDLDSLPQNHVITHEMLSSSHRQATTIELSFEFPFYGSLLKNVTIATGGFLYMGDYLHNWIAATQYIAALMANFDTSMSPQSVIKYVDNGTAFTVQWDKVYIQDKMSDGAFTFQITLLQNGDVIFAYRDIPYPIANISDARHPVKVGISDAYILERHIFFMRQKTIYEYHRIDMIKKSISSNTALYFAALPTCLGFKDCQSCLSGGATLECGWCPAVNRCSDGIDRMRQSWVINGCAIRKQDTCSTPEVSASTEKSRSSTSSSKETEIITKISSVKPSTSKETLPTYSLDNTSRGTTTSENKHEEASRIVHDEKMPEKSISPAAIVTIVIFTLALMGAALWIAYAYKFPQTSSGQFLIKYRPSQWAVKKDDAGVISNSRHL